MGSKSILDEVLEHYPVPFTPRQDQYEDVAALVQWQSSGCFLPVGAGKTFTSTMVALYQALHGRIDQIMVVCPPILLGQWARWFSSFKGVTAAVYRGTPKQREKLDIGADVIILTSGILKNDFEYLMEVFSDRRLFVIVDEATVVRNIQSLTHKAFRDFVATPNKYFTLLTGTELSAPWQAYGYIKLITPTVYRDWLQFFTLHVTGVDLYESPNSYQNLDLLTHNLMLQSVRRQAEDILDLPDVTYVPLNYELDPKHKKLYEQVVEEMLVTLDDGQILDALTPARLRMTAQRVIMMPVEFGGSKIKPAGYGLIDLLASELGNEKFIIYANFHTSCEAIWDYCNAAGFNPVLIYGGPRSTSKLNQLAVRRFVEDKTCRVVVGHPKSCGVGVDGFQAVTRAALFLELPPPDLFVQAVGRIKREGQKNNCIVQMAIAEGTIQVDMQRSAVRKEDWVQKVAPTKESLRAALYGK